MELIVGLLSALVAALVSLGVGLLSFVANRNELRAERERAERELQRSMTARLYELRLEVYPEAIAITDGLRKARLWNLNDPPSRAYFQEVLAQLDAWHSAKAFLLLSRPAVEALYNLRKVLQDVGTSSQDDYSNEYKQRIWEAKGRFRYALRADIQLLYQEELSYGQDE